MLSADYWILHKRVYLSELDDLDDEIRAIVLNYPKSEEAQDLNEKVSNIVEKLLTPAEITDTIET